MNMLLHQQLCDEMLSHAEGRAADAQYELWQAEQDRKAADAAEAKALEDQWRLSVDATVQHRAAIKCRLVESINALQGLLRQAMPYERYAELCVAIVTMSQAHDAIEVQS